ncbi:MAG: hypothetical protein C4320_04395 [Armatimonadota bacterium]
MIAVGFAKSERAAVGAEAAAADWLRRKGGSLRKILDCDEPDLANAFGLDPFECSRARALIELGRRAALVQAEKLAGLDTAESAYEAVRHLELETKEHFIALLLDSQLQIRRTATIHVGTLTASMVGPREVFREAIREAASMVIVAHNHPSGDPTPSPEDRQVTRKLVEVGDLLDIPVMDHIVVGDGRYCSMKRDRLM